MTTPQMSRRLLLSFLRRPRPKASTANTSLPTASPRRTLHAPHSRQNAPIKVSTPNGGHGRRAKPITFLASTGLLSALLVASAQPVAQDTEQQPPATTGPADSRDPSLPRYRLSDVRKHDASSTEPWITWGDKVYDITEWVPGHPGGDVILRAAGGAIDPYWDIFTIHKAPHVYEILSQYLIGYIHADDLVDGKPAAEGIEDPFAQDPKRDARMVTHTAKPCNSEPPTTELTTDFVTPNSLFYVRNHMWVPVVAEQEAKEHKLTVELPDGEERVYTLQDLRSRFKTHTVTAVLQCSGNRRNDMTRHAGKTNGLQWGVGAISNAEWEGVRLADVLADAGLRVADPTQTSITKQPGQGDGTESEEAANPNLLHVQFSGMETYGASIPLPTALDPRGDVLLAFAMNGKPLPRDHGFPLRAIVPGHVAARSVKWLSKIVVSDEESPSQWQRRDYKCFGPNEGGNPDWDRYPAIQQMPVTSAITNVWVGDCVRRSGLKWMASEAKPLDHPTRAEPGVRDLEAWHKDHKPSAREQADAEPVAVAGYAYSGGGRCIQRVDISLDGGRTWDQAELIDGCRDGLRAQNRAWAWRRWRYIGSLPLPHGEQASPATSTKDANGTTLANSCTEILVKATDDAYNTQPEHHLDIYNVRGNLATAWHRVRVCPTCTVSKDGKTTWRTGDHVTGCGFGLEQQPDARNGEGRKDKK